MWGLERKNIYIHKIKSVINLTFIFSALSSVAITSHRLNRARLCEGLEGNWVTNHYIAKEGGHIILNYKLQSVDFSEKSSTWVQLVCSPAQGFTMIFNRVLCDCLFVISPPDGHIPLGYGNTWVKCGVSQYGGIWKLSAEITEKLQCCCGNIPSRIMFFSIGTKEVSSGVFKKVLQKKMKNHL